MLIYLKTLTVTKPARRSWNQVVEILMLTLTLTVCDDVTVVTYDECWILSNGPGLDIYECGCTDPDRL